VLFAGAGAGGFGVYRAQTAAGVLPAGATAAGVVVGVVVGNPDAPVTIDLYLDFQCPACAQYEQQAGATIDELVGSGQAMVVYHPVAYLNRFASTQYSSRSSAAAGCAADAGVLPGSRSCCTRTSRRRAATVCPRSSSWRSVRKPVPAPASPRA
jgi:hypothetical protein